MSVNPEESVVVVLEGRRTNLQVQYIHSDAQLYIVVD